MMTSGADREPRPGWDAFLTDGDRADLASGWAKQAPFGLGSSSALLCVDNVRVSLGEGPDSVADWPLACGPTGWEAIARTRPLLRTARETGTPVVHLVPDADLPMLEAFASRQRPDVDRAYAYGIVPEVAPTASEVVIAKPAHSAFFGTGLMGLLTSLRCDTVVVVGNTTSGCVRATVVDAASYLLKVAVVTDCVYDRTEASHWVNLFDMEHKYADLLPAEEAATYLTSSTGSKPC